MSALRTLILALVLLLAPAGALADVFGLDFGVYLWRAGAEGILDDRGEADLEDDLGLDDKESNAVLWVALEHPLPGLPNIRLQYTPVELSGRGSLGEALSSNDLLFPAGEPVRSELSADQLDVILYWELLDHTLSLDVGLNVKVFDGELRITGLADGQRYWKDLPAAVPMPYLAAGLDLPARLGLVLEVSGSAWDGDRYVDLRAGLTWRLAMLELQGGYRMQQLLLDDLGGLDVDIEIAGPYAGAVLRF